MIPREFLRVTQGLSAYETLHSQGCIDYIYQGLRMLSHGVIDSYWKGTGQTKLMTFLYQNF